MRNNPTIYPPTSLQAGNARSRKPGVPRSARKGGKARANSAGADVGNGGAGGAAGEGAAGEEDAGTSAEGERDGGGESEWEGEGEGEGEGHGCGSPTPREQLLQAQIEALISREREGGGALSHDDGQCPSPQTWPGVQGGPVASLMRAPLEPVKVRLRRAEEVRK